MKPITIEEIIEPLGKDEQAEILHDDFKTPLEYFLEGYNTNPQTTEPVREEAIIKIRTMARKRVAIRNAVQKNPDILKTRVDDPLVIIGIHRSGTTMLNRLLACDPQFCAPMLWEMMEPTPPGRPQDWKECERYRKAIRDFGHSNYNLECNEVDAVHVYELELQEECMLILMDYFLELPEAQYIKTMNKLRDFVYHCPKEHLRKAYEYYKTCLQCIGYQSGRRILVKSGMHILFMDTYKEVFPNAKHILLLRNPKDIIPSLGSLASVHGKDKGFTDNGMGERMLEYFGLATSRAVDFVKNTPEKDLIIIGYKDMIKDPLAAVKSIYSHFDLKLAPEVEEDMRRHMEENRQNKHGKHKYSIDDFGITVEDIKTNLKDFFEFFKDRPEAVL